MVMNEVESKAAAAPQPLRLASVFGDRMILQRDHPFPVWGTGMDGALVTVSCCGQLKTSMIQNGKWFVMMEPLATGPAFTLEAGMHDGDGTFLGQTRLEDVLAGDVYLAGGQSNMEFRIADSTGAAHWAGNADYPDIRSWFSPRVPYVGALAENPEADYAKSPQWQICSADTILQFSAVAFHFARRLHSEIGIPVGILDASWGGSSAACWMDEADLENNPLLTPWLAEHRKLIETMDREAYEVSRREYDDQVHAYQARYAEAKQLELYGPELDAFAGGYPWPPPTGPKNPLSPCGLYHTMLEPMAPFQMKGVIWYQGESDAGDFGSPMGAEKYGLLFGTMMARWRSLFRQPGLPFFFVQLTSFGCDGNPDGENWPLLREQQKMLADTVPGCSMAVIHDYGDLTDIHPKHKQPVGERLALLALNRLYGLPVTASGPVLQSAALEGDSFLLTFTECESGLAAGSSDPLSMRGMYAGDDGSTVLKGFAVAGPDGLFHWAEAAIVGNTVCVKSGEVTAPMALHYGWTNHTQANLFNRSGLPASPFRTMI
jgi:sialate O-acetylesterase